ncbi:hypothetical protein C8Q80DRAFT_1216324 [Daedaleopsis nitida]|nr:hypothetical protein C8Q80DRAFT_1216324 [Daedaleopsis nitida]
MTSPASNTATTSAYLLRSPPPSAPREVPTPLVFVSASKWDARSRTGMDKCAAWFAERGYTCLELDIGPPGSGSGNMSTSEALMRHYESELASHVRLLAIPFAPIIVARAGGTLIAQTYISSHPASALMLISPPPSNAAVTSSSSLSMPSPSPSHSQSLLPTPLPEFNFEPNFPCAVMCMENERERLEAENRLWKDTNVDRMVVRDEAAVVGQEGLVKIEQWLDELGF